MDTEGSASESSVDSRISLRLGWGEWYCESTETCGGRKNWPGGDTYCWGVGDTYCWGVGGMYCWIGVKVERVWEEARNWVISAAISSIFLFFSISSMRL